MAGKALVTAYHHTDPGCPWAYSARPAHARLAWRFGDQIDWRLVMIGLSEDSGRYEARGYTPARVATAVTRFEPRFGMPFGVKVKARVAGTARACRAIVATRLIEPALADPALRALQLLQFADGGLLDADDELRGALARVEGLDAELVVSRIDDPGVVAAYERDRALARSADSSPTHAQDRHSTSDGPVRYTAPSVVFEHADGRRLEVGGFQPFEAYDTALANLDPALERRRPPEDVLAALSVFPHGLTTAEVASVLRPSDLDDPDRSAAQRALLALTGEGRVVADPAGGDALWRLPRAGDAGAAADRTAVPAHG
jgi:protein-disulfide isomerase-like protein with CxxC motif